MEPRTQTMRDNMLTMAECPEATLLSGETAQLKYLYRVGIPSL